MSIFRQPIRACESAPMRSLATSLLMASALLGCPSAPRSATVKGDLIARYLLVDGGVLDLPEDLSVGSLSLYLEASDGGFDVIHGTGSADGTFTFPSVPDGRFIVSIADVFLSTTAHELHLGENVAGRPGVFIANPGEGLRLTATNLAPWSPDDELQLTSWNAGIDAFSTAQSRRIMRENAPDAGDTALTGLWLDLDGYRVVEAAKGDDLRLLQLSAHSTDGGLHWKSVTRAASLAVDLAMNRLTPATVALDEVVQQPITARFDQGSFEEAAVEVHPEAVALEGRWLLDAHLGAFGPNTISTGAPDLATVSSSPGAGVISLDLTWGNPFPRAFTPFVSVAVRFEALYRAPQPDGGFSPSRSETAVVSRVVSLEAASQTLDAPLMPVRNVRVDGVTIDDQFPHVAATPLVSWEPPRRGSPTIIDLQAVALDPGVTTLRTEGPTLRVVGDVTSLRLPPGFLDPGAVQYLRLTAIAQPPEWNSSTPRRDVGPPAATATAMTRAFIATP